MFILDLSNFAFLEGILFLLIAYLVYRHGLRAAQKKGGVAKLLKGLGFPKRIFSRVFFSAMAISVLFVFVILLLVLEEKLTALAFVAGVLSLAVLMLFADRALLFADAVKEHTFVGPITGMSLSGMTLAGVGLFFYIFTWEEASVVSGFALGGSFVFFFISCGRGDEGSEKIGRPFRDDLADMYTSYTCVLVAAIAIGTNIEYHQRVWTGMPFLFAMAGLMVSGAATFYTMTVADENRPRVIRHAEYLSGVLCLAMIGFIDQELTKKMTADAIAYSGLVDRLGPFCAAASGWVTGILINAVHRHDAAGKATGDQRFAPMAFYVYLLAMGLWIADLFAGLYGIALSGLGMLATLCMDACQRGSANDGEEMRRFSFSAAVFAAFALFAAFSATVKSAVEAGDFFMDGAGELVVPGLLLSGLVPFLAPALAKRFSSWPFLLGTILLLVPCVIGSLIGPEALGGFILGSILLCAFHGLWKNRNGGKDMTLASAVMKLVGVVSLVLGPAIIRLYDVLH